jgi:hypothetical protein
VDREALLEDGLGKGLFGERVSNGSAQAALAHQVTKAVQAAYERGGKFKKRRELMQAWADYCGHV